MRTGTMFETLLQYRDMNFYKEHPTLTFDSVYEEGEYKVIGMFIANTRPEDGPIFDYLNFLDGTEETFMEYVENVRERSLITTGVDVQPGDRLITLSTCSYEFTEARFVVVARKIREGEDPEVGYPRRPTRILTRSCPGSGMSSTAATIPMRRAVPAPLPVRQARPAPPAVRVLPAAPARPVLLRAPVRPRVPVLPAVLPVRRRKRKTIMRSMMIWQMGNWL